MVAHPVFGKKIPPKTSSFDSTSPNWGWSMGRGGPSGLRFILNCDSGPKRASSSAFESTSYGTPTVSMCPVVTSRKRWLSFSRRKSPPVSRSDAYLSPDDKWPDRERQPCREKIHIRNASNVSSRRVPAFWVRANVLLPLLTVMITFPRELSITQNPTLPLVRSKF